MKKQLLLILGLMFTVSMAAAPVTKEAAKKNVLSFLKSKNGAKVFATSGLNQTQLEAVDYQAGGNAFYVFNFTNKPGFVIAAADDRVEPILGYSHEGSFDPQNVPSNMKGWLDIYSDQISHVVKANLSTPVQRMSSASKETYRHNIPIMLKSRWNQQTPYNDLCPQFSGDAERRPTGCVATAMAQVLYYHKWPKGELPGMPAYNYYDDPNFGGNSATRYMKAIPAITLDWDNMTDEYGYNSTQESKKAVAELMLYCGYAVEMEYHPWASGALTFEIPRGLRDHLGYDKGAKYLDHEGYTEKEWENIVYNELINNRPVLYSGATEAGGHQFVCDGYENGFFHFNWGWGGVSDGYFKLTVLDPNQNGVVGGNGMNFSASQQIVIGVQPPVEGTVKPENALRIGALTLTSSLNGVLSKNNLGRFSLDVKAYYGINCEKDMYIDYGFGLYDQNNNLLELSYVANDKFYTGYPQDTKIRNAKVNVGKSDKKILSKDGKYYLRPVIKDSNGNYKIMEGGDKLYFDITITGSKVLVRTCPQPNVEISNITLDTPVYYQTDTKLRATIENKGEDFNGFAYLMQDGKIESGVWEMVSLNKGEVKDISLSFAPIQSGKHTFGVSLNGYCNSEGVVLDVYDNQSINASLVINPDPEAKVEGNFFDIPVEISNSSVSDPYKSFIIATLYMKDGSTYNKISENKLPVSLEVGGKSTVNVHFDNLGMNKIYYIGFSYVVNGYVEAYGGVDKYKNPLKVFKYKTPDGICYYDAYGNLEGKVVNEGETFQIPSSACYVVVPKNVSGRKFLLNDNKNCLYSVRQGVSVADFNGANIIRSGSCSKLSLTDASDFYSVEPITASNVELAIKADKELTAVALPFVPAGATCEGQELHMASSLAELATADYAILPIVAEESDKIYCDFDQSFFLSAPSILVVNKKYIGKQIVFTAKNVVVNFSNNKINGEYFNLNTSSRNAVVEGTYGFGISAFSTSLSKISPFHLYLTSVGPTDVKDVKIVYPEGMTTGIEEIDSDLEGKMVYVYSIDGVKVKTVKYGRNMLEGLPSGLYIVNGKKFVK